MEEPHELAPGCLATGPIPRRADFEKGMGEGYHRTDDESVPDPIDGDQVVVIHAERKDWWGPNVHTWGSPTGFSVLRGSPASRNRRRPLVAFASAMLRRSASNGP